MGLSRPLGQNAGYGIARLRSSASGLKPNPNSVPEFDPNPSLTITPFCIYILYFHSLSETVNYLTNIS